MIAVLTPSLSGALSPEWTGRVASNLDDRPFDAYRVIGQPILEARIRTTRSAFFNGAEWFWFLDDDVYPPRSVLGRLLAHKCDFVSAVCTTRSARPVACFGVADGRGVYRWGALDWSWPGEPIEVDVVGLGCALVSRRVLEAVGPDDWFRWDWRRTLADGRTVVQCKGEDVWLCEQARARGFSIRVDPTLHCRHVDRETEISYPDPDFWERHRRPDR